MLTLYGIKACDTMKRAFTFLDEEGVAYDFHDYKKLGLPEELAADMLGALGAKTLVNTRGTTWRKLGAEDQGKVDAGGAAALLSAHTSLAKRPVWRLETEAGVEWRTGFPKGSDEEFRAWLGINAA